jgi:hypothetical protein
MHLVYRALQGDMIPDQVRMPISVGDLDSDPQDPHVFGPPGSGSISHEVWIRIRILPFSHKGVERTEIMFAK